MQVIIFIYLFIRLFVCNISNYCGRNSGGSYFVYKNSKTIEKKQYSHSHYDEASFHCENLEYIQQILNLICSITMKSWFFMKRDSY